MICSPGMKSAAFTEAFEQAVPVAEAFEKKYKGKLGKLLKAADRLTDAIADYEKLEEELGRIALLCRAALCRKFRRSGSCEILRRCAGATDPSRPASAVFSAGTEPARRCKASMRQWRQARSLPLPAVDQRSAPRQALSAAMSSRKAVSWRNPRPASGAFNRLFDETMSSLRFDVDGEELAIEPTLNLMQTRTAESASRPPTRWLRPSGQSASLHADHQYAGQGQGDSDRWRGFGMSPIRAIWPTVSSGRWSMRWSQRSKRSFPRMSHRYYAMKAKWLGMDELNTGTAMRRCPSADSAASLGNGARNCAVAYAAFARDGGDRARFLRRNWIDAPVRPASRPALSPIRPCPAAPLCAAQLSGQAARRDDAGA